MFFKQTFAFSSIAVDFGSISDKLDSEVFALACPLLNFLLLNDKRLSFDISGVEVMNETFWKFLIGGSLILKFVFACSV